MTNFSSQVKWKRGRPAGGGSPLEEITDGTLRFFELDVYGTLPEVSCFPSSPLVHYLTNEKDEENRSWT